MILYQKTKVGNGYQDCVPEDIYYYPPQPSSYSSQHQTSLYTLIIKIKLTITLHYSCLFYQFSEDPSLRYRSFSSCYRLFIMKTIFLLHTCVFVAAGGVLSLILDSVLPLDRYPVSPVSDGARRRAEDQVTEAVSIRRTLGNHRTLFNIS